MSNPATSTSALSYLARGLPRCTHAYKPNRNWDIDFCDINNRVCELESGNKCDKYDEELGDNGR